MFDPTCTEDCAAPEGVPANSESNTDENIQNLYKWLNELGGKLNKVKVNEFEPGKNGMIATDDIAQGDLIAFIPDDMLLTVSEAKSKSEAYKIILEKDILP